MGRRFKKRRKSQETATVLAAFDAATAEYERITPRCQHFGTCGGCNLQDLTYLDQVAAKRDVFVSLAQQQSIDLDIEISDIAVVASEQDFGYRQRMDFVHMPDGTGLRKAGQFRSVVPLSECPLVGDRAVKAMHRARDLAQESGVLPAYNIMSHEGVLRYVVVRRNRANQLLVSLVTTDVAPETVVASIAEQLLAEELVESVHWLHHNGLGDTSFGTEYQHWGLATLPESIHELSFELGPNSFSS